jgi:imidazolonepropionase-like amidohydrolase
LDLEHRHATFRILRMVERFLLFFLLLSTAQAKPLLLKGFTLVDPINGTSKIADLRIEGDKIISGTAHEEVQIIEGHGRFLIPAFWDMETWLWGNESGASHKDLYQDLNISQSLRIELFYGVAHVVGSHMSREWLEGGLARIEDMQIASAEAVFPGRNLGGTACIDGGCTPLNSSTPAVALIADMKARGVPFIQINYGDPVRHPKLGLDKPLLGEVLRAAVKCGMKTCVFFETWSGAADAVNFGANLIHGMGEGEIPEALVRQMREKKCAFSPRLAFFLEPIRLAGNLEAIEEPFLGDSVPPAILASLGDPQKIWNGWRWIVDFGQKNRNSIFSTLRRVSSANIPIVSSTESGCSIGLFHGFSTHANQAWMQAAGLGAWTRLRSITQWPAEFMNRRVGFEIGDPADFVALDGDPLLDFRQLRKISFLIRNGEILSRDSLKPDLMRTGFKP